jgi:hypothetical protein
MELGENIRRIKDNLFLIPEERFDELTKDTGYKTSFIYLLACLVLSIPFGIIVSLFMGGLFDTIFVIPLAFVISIIVNYISFGVLFLFLKLVGGKASFLKSVQVFIYGSTIELILSGIPIIGLIAGLIALANIVIGSKRIHKISLLRAILALLVIPIVVLILVGILVFISMASLLGSMGGLLVG